MFRNKIKQSKVSVRSLLLFIFSLFPVFYSVAQSHLVIEGVVTDVATKNNIPHAIVTLRCGDTLVNTVADENGKYSFSSSIVKTDKTYVLYAHCEKPLYGYAGNNEYFASTYGLGSNTRVYERNIELKAGIANAQAAILSSCVHFRFKGSDIERPAKDTALNAWLHYLKNNPTYVVEIEGYADKKEGNKDFRLMLSRARSQQCINYLHDNGIELARLRLMGNGSNSPVITPKEIRKIKGKEAKMAARLLNCRSEIILKNIFYPPPSTIVMSGMVSDINTNEPVKGALIIFSGSDGAQFTFLSDSTGRFASTISNFNPVTFYNVVAGANGYNSSDPEDVFRITPDSKDQPIYSHNFRISRNGYEKPFIFPPILFDSGSVTLSKPAIDSLNSVKKIMNKQPGLVVEFAGDADRHEQDFVRLAKTRAWVCIDYLVNQGIDPGRFIVGSMENERSLEEEKKSTNSMVLKKEKQRAFNKKKCSVSFWIMRWDYTKPPSQ